MAAVKNLHFLAAIVFTLNGLARAYWFFAGNTYRQWFRFHIWRGLLAGSLVEVEGVRVTPL